MACCLKAIQICTFAVVVRDIHEIRSRTGSTDDEVFKLDAVAG